MRLVRFTYSGVAGYGRLEGDEVVPLEAAGLAQAFTAKPSAPPLRLKDVKLVAPVARPGKILGIGVNYAEHAAESVSFVNTAKPEVQKWFNKQATATNGPYDPVHLPKVSPQLDYEGELVVVIGKHGRHVPRARAMEIVAGFCVGGDYSVRDWQRASQTMIMGKGFDTHAVFGPAIVTPDEAGDIASLEIRTFVNGERRQTGRPSQMIHDIPAQIEHLTAAFTLEPGDVIFTGTPAGVGAGFDPPRWLKAGDTVRVEIDGLGHIENKIVDEPETMRIG
ncbi:fumarylacetoacetate hydrolase family protein [Hyphomonas sp.]|uniref:fumarylacetoacetate hydrolase family protein n=1 Tax=Hyphomonas sp. TaxID=87 RepID=UPI00391B5DBC